MNVHVSESSTASILSTRLPVEWQLGGIVVGVRVGLALLPAVVTDLDEVERTEGVHRWEVRAQIVAALVELVVIFTQLGSSREF